MPESPFMVLLRKYGVTVPKLPNLDLSRQLGRDGRAAAVELGDDVGMNLLENFPDRRRERIAGAAGAGLEITVGLEHASVIIAHAVKCSCVTIHVHSLPLHARG